MGDEEKKILNLKSTFNKTISCFRINQDFAWTGVNKQLFKVWKVLVGEIQNYVWRYG